MWSESLAIENPDELQNRLFNQMNACVSCALCQNRNSVCLPDGHWTAKVMIVLEGPGFLEDLAAVPLVGPKTLESSRCNRCANIRKCYATKLLTKINERKWRSAEVKCKPDFVPNPVLDKGFFLRSAGTVFDGILIQKWGFMYPRHSWLVEYNRRHPEDPWTHLSPWFITNAVMCRSYDRNTLRDEPPTNACRNACRKWLLYSWALIEPKVIVAFGRPALASIMGNESAAQRVKPGTLVDTKLGPTIFTYHPAFFMRDDNEKSKALGYARIGEALEIALDMAGIKGPYYGEQNEDDRD